MSIQVDPLGNRGIAIEIRDRLEAEDYREFLPVAEKIIDEHDKIDILVHLLEFRGWSPRGLWEELRFVRSHYDDVDRLALVGNEVAEQWLTVMSEPLIKATIRKFAEQELAEARRWIARDSD